MAGSIIILVYISSLDFSCQKMENNFVAPLYNFFYLSITDSLKSFTQLYCLQIIFSAFTFQQAEHYFAATKEMRHWYLCMLHT